MENEKKPRVIISGGGTGGHIFPAVSIALAVKSLCPDAEILFVGAEGRMEMQRVPEAGFEIKGLPICGFDRKNPLKNIAVIFKIIRSQRMARKIIKEFRPMVAVGVGGYASGPTLRMAERMGVPTLLQEQNSYAGVTNKILAKKASRICVAYDGMDRFFPADKIMLTGNPVRPSLTDNLTGRDQAARMMGLDPDKKIILIIGGSLGARTLNESVMSSLELIRMSSDIQFLWQTGKFYFDEMKRRLSETDPVPNLFPTDFVQDMDLAYAAADMVISRAGAGTISELCLLGKPVILVPSPNVAEDHQTKNAMALSEKNAAIHIADAVSRKELIPTAVDVVQDKERLKSLSENIIKLGIGDSAVTIAREVLALAGFKVGKVALKDIKAVYFVGAGGIGMSALERYFLSRGCEVAGYDRTSSELTSELMAEGVQIHFEDDQRLIPDEFKDRDSTLVVYTPAIKITDNSELRWFHSNGFDVQKRAQVLGTLTRSLDGLCVAGTHGKTTTSSMTAHILHGMPEGCNAFLGGILKNYNSNLLTSPDSRYVVIEADEYDRSFHNLRPLRSVITAIDADHLDIYGNYDNYVEGFRKYTSLIKPGGALILNSKLEESFKPDLQEGVSLYTYGVEKGDFHASSVVIKDGELKFDLISPVESITDIELGVPIPINVENAVAAIALAQLSGADRNVIREAMKSFRGCDRRFDFRLKGDKVYLTDYAHHPAELRQCALSLRKLYENRKITAIFQPHLYSRTKDFYNEFAESLSLFDEVWLTEIYPAREEPIPGVSSSIIADNMKPGVCKGIIFKDDVEGLVRSIKDEIQVLVTVGAGDLEDYADKITEILRSK
ncbi:MAG: UDP-N-acetylmuramate--L-alanine ligase [Bacteroidaceae bacterium]|nr:UDP-N-acetylmuramate--L-alanine ligase [Bacteroidaceae bacterium]